MSAAYDEVVRRISAAFDTLGPSDRMEVFGALVYCLIDRLSYDEVVDLELALHETFARRKRELLA